MSNLTQEEFEALRKYKTDLPYYAGKILKIMDKPGKVLPLEYNRAQLYTHQKLEEQLARIGKVRAIVLKGRQQGISTYIGSRFYHKINFRRGLNAFILSHARDTSDKLFKMVDRFYENSPEHMRHRTETASAKELLFAPPVESGYRIGTAGSKAVGRGGTLQLFHGSEVAFWPDADMHLSGILQSVADAPDTEVVLESTANGLGNVFHTKWQEAESGITDLMPVFIPWYWQEEYRKEPPPGWKPSHEEMEYGDLYKLGLDQLFWRNQKIIELGSDWKFKQEYPGNAVEAFQTSGVDCFIDPQTVMAARSEKDLIRDGANLGGCDPARFGDDQTAFYQRIGRWASRHSVVKGQDLMAITGHCVRFIVDKNLDKLFLDVVGIGAGVYDRLIELGYSDKIIAVNGATRAMDEQRFANKRAECWGLMKEWIINGPVEIPNLDSLHSDLTAPKYGFDSRGRLLLEKKEDMKKRGIHSPDEGDALAMTFAEPVANMAVRNSSLGARPRFAESEYQIFGG